MIMLSSAGQMEDSARCLELGILRCLIKPVKQSDLREAILRVLGRGNETALSSELPRASKRADQSPRRILLAEDGIVNQQVASRLLESRGHTVVLVNNGAEALAALERSKFDLVLMDVQMPVMDGFDATAAIRGKEQATGRHIPIIAMTAHAMKGDRERCLAAGMDGYISKPIHANALYQAVEEIPINSEPAVAAAAGVATEARKILDWESALHRVGGRNDLLKEIVRLFFKESDKLMPEIQAAMHSRDCVKLRRVAHSLKGSADCFAAEPTVNAALRLEIMARDGNLADAETAFADLQREVEQLRLALASRAKG